MSASTFNSVVNNAVNSSVLLWHYRFGHFPVHVFKHIPFLSNCNIVSSFNSSVCEICHYARQTRVPFPISSSHCANAFDIIHCDVWGPYRHLTYDGCFSFLTIVDDFSRTTWTFLLKSKAHVFHYLKTFLLMVTNQFNSTVKEIRLGNGSEFFNDEVSSLLQSLGILQQSTCNDTPQQNGRVERKHRNLLEMARALRFQGYLPIKFWGDCIQTATYLLNGLPNSVLKFKTPYEVLLGKPPTYTHLKVLGCLCFASSLSHNGDKFQARAIKCVFLGYPYGKKAYKLLDLNTHKVIYSRDVKFCESIFPFQSFSSSQPSFSLPAFLLHPSLFMIKLSLLSLISLLLIPLPL